MPMAPDSKPQDSDRAQAAILQMADTIRYKLGELSADDTMLEDSPCSLKELLEQPDKALSTAYCEINAVAFKDVAPCWLRLYEDASLAKVAKLLERHAEQIGLDDEKHICAVIETLDKGIAFSGAPYRRDLFDSVFAELDNLLGEESTGPPNPFHITAPDTFHSASPIGHSPYPLELEAFQNHIYHIRKPFIMAGCFDNWLAMERWQDSSYFLHRTLGGRRLVPVEIGESYSAELFRQAVIPFREFLQSYILPEKPHEVGYLAQHELFTQIPALAQDISVPDYCYISPPQPALNSAAALTPGLDSVNQLEDPLVNAWLGPKGTKTPLHTDPYHNILCQVVGYKYVRLYSPEQRNFLYPDTVDKNGIRMDNTSQIDISPVVAVSSRTKDLDSDLVDAQKIQLRKRFPLFDQAEYVEAILAPGECLYIPLGWWHYVESLTTSASVSFWWN